jgi:GNAT superfamily N-acetyltransferase
VLGRARTLPRLKSWRARSSGDPSVVVAGPEHVAALERLVESSAARHVHVGSFIDTIGQPMLREHRLWVVLDGDTVLAALQHFRGLSWATPGSGDLEPRLAEVLSRFVDRRGAATEIVFGPDRATHALLERARARRWHPVEIRRQELLAASRGSREAAREPAPAGYSLRPAAPDDLEWLMEAHAGMCVEDLGQDQVRRHPDSYRRYFQDLIGRRCVWVGESAGEPVFKAETPLESAQARLVEGVYTVPAARGRGYAGWSMAWLTQRASADGRCACLYVHRRNDVARRLYRRIGYQQVCRWTTVKLTSAPRGGHEPVVL